MPSGERPFSAMAYGLDHTCPHSDLLQTHSRIRVTVSFTTA